MVEYVELEDASGHVLLETSGGLLLETSFSVLHGSVTVSVTATVTTAGGSHHVVHGSAVVTETVTITVASTGTFHATALLVETVGITTVGTVHHLLRQLPAPILGRTELAADGSISRARRGALALTTRK